MKPRQRQLPEPTYPVSVERDYNRFLNLYVQTYVSLMRKGLKEILPDLKEVAGNEQPRADENIESKVKRMFEWVQTSLHRAFPDPVLRGWALYMVARVSKSSKKVMGKQMAAAYKRAGKEAPDFEPLMHDRKLSAYYQNVVDENVGLIRSIPLEKLPVFKNQLVAMITSDQPSKEIQKAIQKNFDLTKNKAALIAVDQVGKLNGALEEHRQTQLGLSRYIWRDSGDIRVRKDHHKLDGTVQLWSKPPIVDRRTGRRAHPKRDFLCRCWAEPYLSDIMDD